MIDDAIDELKKHNKDITALIMIADSEEFQIVKVGAHGATTQQMLALVGTLEMVKSDLLNSIRNGDGVDEEPPEDDDDITLQ
jgi:hypothetical protein